MLAGPGDSRQRGLLLAGILQFCCGARIHAQTRSAPSRAAVPAAWLGSSKLQAWTTLAGKDGTSSLLICSSRASRRSRSDTRVAPSASIISRRRPRAHSMPDLTAVVMRAGGRWQVVGQGAKPWCAPTLHARAGRLGRRENSVGSAAAALSGRLVSSRACHPVPLVYSPRARRATHPPTCVALAAVAGQAQHAHGVKAVAAHELSGSARGAVAGAVVHHYDLPSEVGALAVAPPLQVAAARGGGRCGAEGAPSSALQASTASLQGTAARVDPRRRGPRRAATARRRASAHLSVSVSVAGRRSSSL